MTEDSRIRIVSGRSSQKAQERMTCMGSERTWDSEATSTQALKVCRAFLSGLRMSWSCDLHPSPQSACHFFQWSGAASDRSTPPRACPIWNILGKCQFPGSTKSLPTVISLGCKLCKSWTTSVFCIAAFLKVAQEEIGICKKWMNVRSLELQSSSRA